MIRKLLVLTAVADLSWFDWFSKRSFMFKYPSIFCTRSSLFVTEGQETTLFLYVSTQSSIFANFGFI